jgi:hypothetical protein
MTTTKNIFLRFGDLPAAGKSQCHTLTDGTWDEGRWDDLADDRKAEFEAVGYSEQDGIVYEPGVSVYELDPMSDPSEKIIEFHIGTSRRADVLFVIDRPAYLVSGTRLDSTGFCGEPLLCDATVVESVELVSFKRGILTVKRVS